MSLSQDLLFSSVIFSLIGALIFTWYGAIGALKYYTLNSPYVAAFFGLGIAVGILLAMCMILTHNYREKMESGQRLVNYDSH